jgi:UDP-N-acetyl-D-glucosamine dehydrogenase
LLVGSGAEVTYHDPYIPYLPEHKLVSVELTQEELEQTDCVVIATDHRAVNVRPVVSHAPKVVDLRNAVRRKLGVLPDNVDVL